MFTRRRADQQKQVNKLFIYSGGQLKFPTWNELNPEIQISKDQEPPSIDVLWTTNPSAMDELGQVIRDSKAWEDDSLVDLLLS